MARKKEIKRARVEKKPITRIDFFKNTKSQHGVLHHFMQGLQRAIRRLGIHSSTYDILGEPLTAILSQLARDKPDCTVGFNVVVPEALFYETLGIPHCALIVDSATYYPELFRCPNTIASFAEMDSVHFMEALKKQYLFFFPHAYDKAFASKKLPSTSRKHDLFMPASFIDADMPFALLKELFPAKVVSLIDDIIEASLASPNVSHLTALKTFFDKNRENQDSVLEKGATLFDVFNTIELIMRGRDRIRLAEALEDFDLTIACSHDDRELWKKALKKKKHIRFHDPIPYSQLYHTLLTSRIVVNSIPTIKRGFHERMFLAASAGASVLTNSSLFQNEYFPENRAVLTYLSPRYKEANAKIKEVLNNEEGRLQDVMQLKKKVLEEHTWDVRAKYLVDTLQEKLTQVPKPESDLGSLLG